MSRVIKADLISSLSPPHDPPTVEVHPLKCTEVCWHSAYFYPEGCVCVCCPFVCCHGWASFTSSQYQTIPEGWAHPPWVLHSPDRDDKSQTRQRCTIASAEYQHTLVVLSVQGHITDSPPIHPTSAQAFRHLTVLIDTHASSRLQACFCSHVRQTAPTLSSKGATFSFGIISRVVLVMNTLTCIYALMIIRNTYWYKLV